MTATPDVYEFQDAVQDVLTIGASLVEHDDATLSLAFLHAGAEHQCATANLPDDHEAHGTPGRRPDRPHGHDPPTRSR